MEKRKRGRPRKNIQPLISEEKGELAIVGTSSRKDIQPLISEEKGKLAIVGTSSRKDIQPLISEEKGKIAIVGTSSPVRRRPEFFKLFLSDWSSKKLILPQELSGECIKERSKIKDLCGNVWNVSVEKSEDGQVSFTGKGWKDFIKYHSLKDGYFLVFKYDDEGDSSFTVKVFTTTNVCKKPLPFSIQQIKGRQHVIYKY